METWTIFLVLNSHGCNQLEEYIKLLLENTTSTKFQSNKSAVLLPPKCIQNLFSDENNFNSLSHGFYAWASNDMIATASFCCILKDLQDEHFSCSSMSEDTAIFLSESIHQLANELPAPCSCILEVYLLSGDDILYPSPPLNLLAAMKRLEVWHNAFFATVTTNSKDVKINCNEWDSYIDFKVLTLPELNHHATSDALWYGSLNLILEKKSGDHHLNHSFLALSSEEVNTVPFLQSMEHSYDKLTYDKEIHIVALLNQEDIPFHLVYPTKFHLFSYNSCSNNSTFSFFEFCSQKKNCWFLAFLKFDFIPLNKQRKLLEDEWNSYVNDAFTHHLSATLQTPLLKNHATMLIRSNQPNQSLDVYFLHDKDTINSRGYFELLKYCDFEMEEKKVFEQTPNDDETRDKERCQFYQTATECIDHEQWCEKTSWHLEENSSKFNKSISRCKSDEFYINGVMIPPVESMKSGLHHDSFSQFLTLFDEHGKPLNQDLQPIPVISDRLLKNIKAEEYVKSLSYVEAERLIGHGLEYCVDSYCAVRLDSRLLKIQNRYVPQDTINLNSYNPKPTDDTNTTTKRRTSPRKLVKTSNVNKHSDVKASTSKPAKTKVAAEKDMESRSQRHKRRLRTIISGTLTKYGKLTGDEPGFKRCCDKLFTICVPLIKDLVSSKGLNQQMKDIAKAHFQEVIQADIT